GRDCSMSALQERLGEFTPAAQQRSLERPHHHAPQPLDPASKPWQQYIGKRARHATERASFRDRMTEHQGDEWRRAAEHHRRERADLLGRSWKGQGDLLNATRSVLAAQQAQEKAALRDRQKLEREEIRRAQRFPSFKTWLTERNPELAQEWRHRERRPAAIEGPAFEQPAPCDIRAFQAAVDGGRVHYHRNGERGRPAFTDCGKVIDIRDSQRRETVLAALQLSAQKWGTITVHGDAEFRRVCVELAAEHEFKIVNPELQRAIARGRECTRAERLPLPRPTVKSVAEAYRLHFDELVRESAAPKTDPSRFDSDVAVCLRLTGHHREAIIEAIKEGAAASRPSERRDWDAYARRAVDFAFGLPGSQLAHTFALRREHLLRVEGRSLENEMASRGRGRAPLGR
ncbi:MAG TPA: LPD7 domain-containing protein, partial [Polyangia bacterium]|nr:LPD7 domain-containing protein [Polyangia bacterium]